MTSDDSEPQENSKYNLPISDQAHEQACSYMHAVPIEELESLADKWDMNANLNAVAVSEDIDDGSSVAADVFQDCAQELREVIQDYE